MVYRAVLGILFLVAVVLTLNERWQEQRAHALADRGAGQAPGAAIGGPPSATMATPVRGSAASRPAIAFVPHRVRVRDETELLQAPEPMARPVEPVSRIPAGILVQAIDERNGWFLVDSNLSRGWAPIDAFEEP